ncbi:MAG TPA: hypothetical protein DDW34_09885 [Clostridium sp.]|nr:hypothetical protein [Clostridium sp.]
MNGFLDSPSFRVDREANKKEYAWEFTKDKEVWEHGYFESVEKCVEDYLKNYASDSPQNTIYVAECERYIFSVDGSAVIDNLEGQAFDECGEAAEGWEPSSGIRDESWSELDEQLTKVVTNWLKKHGDMPNFYSIVSVVEVPVRLYSEE